MEQATPQAVAALLSQSGAAHGAYEENELGGVYDQDWPSWYAAYLVQHGIGSLLGTPITAERLASLLVECDAAYKRERPTQDWPVFYARKLIAAVH